MSLLLPAIRAADMRFLSLYIIRCGNRNKDRAAWRVISRY
jgi:hypothetical protein